MELIEIETNLYAALEDAKQKQKKNWWADVEDKAYLDGEIYAYQSALQMVKKAIERSKLMEKS